MDKTQSTIIFIFYLVVGAWFTGLSTFVFLRMRRNVKDHIKKIEDDFAFDRLLDNDLELRKLHEESYDIIDDNKD